MTDPEAHWRAMQAASDRLYRTAVDRDVERAREALESAQTELEALEE